MPLLLNYVVECYTIHAIDVSVAMNAWRLNFALVVGFLVVPRTEAVGRRWLFGMAILFCIWREYCTLVGLLAWKGQKIRASFVPSISSVNDDGVRVAEDTYC